MEEMALCFFLKFTISLDVFGSGPPSTQSVVHSSTVEEEIVVGGSPSSVSVQQSS